jgi:hypothetical protein
VAEAISAFVPDFTGLKPGASIAESILLLQTFNEPSGEKRKSDSEWIIDINQYLY